MFKISLKTCLFRILSRTFKRLKDAFSKGLEGFEIARRPQILFSRLFNFLSFSKNKSYR